MARRTFITVGVFSAFVNLLMLTMPIYLFQISDRVLTSRSMETLVMLSLLALGLSSCFRCWILCGARCSAGWRRGWRPSSARPVLASIVTTAPVERRRQRAAAAQPAPGARLHLQPDHADPVRCADGAAVFRRRVSHPSASSAASFSLPGIALIAIAMFNQRATSAPLVPGRHAAARGRRAGGGAGAQFAGHQRHGNAQRGRAAMGARAGAAR